MIGLSAANVFVLFSTAVALYCISNSLKTSMQGYSTIQRCSETHNSKINNCSQSRRKAISEFGKHSLISGTVSLAGPVASDALFEDFRKKGGCPNYEEIRGPSVSDFKIDKYMGVWYELAYHDWTQYSICGCTRFNMTKRDEIIEDMFTTQCPTLVGQTYAVNMSMAINPNTPGQFLEKAFYTYWPNMVLDVWDEGIYQTDSKSVSLYGKAIQMQCVQIMGRKAFVGINFLSRSPISTAEALNEMWQRASILGIAPYGGNREEMEIVKHDGCEYPRTTDEGVIMRSERAGLGAILGVKILDKSLLTKPPL